jgi:hypothetical protein
MLRNIAMGPTIIVAFADRPLELFGPRSMNERLVTVTLASRLRTGVVLSALRCCKDLIRRRRNTS